MGVWKLASPVCLSTMVMIMSTYKYNYLRARQTTRLPSEIIFAVLPSSSLPLPPSLPPFPARPSHPLARPPMSLSKLVYETSSETNDLSPLRAVSTICSSDEACLCVTDLRRDTTLSKGTPSFIQNACHFSVSVFALFYAFLVFFSYGIPCRPRVRKSAQGIALFARVAESSRSREASLAFVRTGIVCRSRVCREARVIANKRKYPPRPAV